MKNLILSICLFVSLCFLGLRAYPLEPIDPGVPIDSLRNLYASGNTRLWPKPNVDSIVIDFKEIGNLSAVTYPKDNPYSEAKEKLGKTLFFDPRLSSSRQIACASCHDPELAWADGRELAYGHDRLRGKRNSMSIFNTAYYNSLFWDSRASSLEDQVHFPLTDPVEMHSTDSIAVAHVMEIEGYKKLFANAFGNDSINFSRITKAIATFERGIVSGSTKFDKFIKGKKEAYTNQEVWGLHLFRTKARCINCHNSPLFSDNQLHNEGLVYYQRKFEDLGRYNITQQAKDVGKMRTPSLREISRTAPYMHNGLFPDLDNVLNMYNAGMFHPKRLPKYKNDSLFPVTSALLKPLDLSKEEKQAIIAFLGTLSSRKKRTIVPEMPQ